MYIVFSIFYLAYLIIVYAIWFQIYTKLFLVCRIWLSFQQIKMAFSFVFFFYFCVFVGPTSLICVVIFMPVAHPSYSGLGSFKNPCSRWLLC